MENSTAKHEAWLLETYGPLIGGKELRFLLGYKSGTAFRTAINRGTLPVPTITQPSRRKRVARAKDIAEWLASVDQQIEEKLD